MKKNRFAGRCLTFFLLIGLSSGLMVSCTEKSEDIVKNKTITEVIIENDNFSILEEIMLNAEMSDALRAGEITFFAPDNEAFGKANIFSSSVITSRGADSARIFLQNHIVPKERLAYEFIQTGKKKTLTGKEIEFTKVDSVVNVNKSEIVIPDLSAANGVIHVIDSLIVR